MVCYSVAQDVPNAGPVALFGELFNSGASQAIRGGRKRGQEGRGIARGDILGPFPTLFTIYVRHTYGEVHAPKRTLAKHLHKQ